MLHNYYCNSQAPSSQQTITGRAEDSSPILKFIKMVLKFENDFKISEFYRSQTFQKIEKWWDFLKISNFRKMKAGGAPALRVPRAETWVTVDRSLPYGCTVQLVGGQKNVELFIILGFFVPSWWIRSLWFDPSVFFSWSPAKKKTWELFCYSITRAK